MEQETTVRFTSYAEMQSSVPPEYIAALAYELWQGRGCPVGSSETDWLQAEQALMEWRGVRY